MKTDPMQFFCALSYCQTNTAYVFFSFFLWIVLTTSPQSGLPRHKPPKAGLVTAAGELTPATEFGQGILKLDSN